MTNGVEEENSPVVLVLDRTHPDFEQYLWDVRQWLHEVNRPFAMWAGAPERGRFIVFTLIPQLNLTVGQWLTFPDSELELVEILRANVMGKSSFALHLWVVREVLDRISDILGPCAPIGVTIEWHKPPGKGR